MVTETHLYPFAALLQEQKVIPVVALHNEEQAKGVTEALLGGGISCIEITLRTDYGMQAIEMVKASYPEMLVIAGTVTDAAAYHDVVQAGAQAVVSPGVTQTLLQAAKDHAIPFMPGVVSASDIMLVMQSNLYECKLFPATIAGGIPALNAYNGPFQDTVFCPTGGVSESNFLKYLSLTNVICVGGSWLTPSATIANQDWNTITKLSKRANQMIASSVA